MKRPKMGKFLCFIIPLIMIAVLCHASYAALKQGTQSPQATNLELDNSILDEVIERNEVLQDNIELFDCTPNYTRSGERVDEDKKPDILNQPL